MPSSVSAHRFSGAQDDVGAPRPVVVALGQERVERVLAGVPAGPVAAVVAERDGVGQGDVEPGAAGDRGGHLGDLERVGQPGPLVVGRVDHDLGLAGQPAEGGGVHDPVAVALEAGALGRPAPRARLAVPGADGEGGPGPQGLAARSSSRSSPVDHRARADRGVRVGVGPDQPAAPACPAMVVGPGLGPRADADRRGGSATRDAQLGRRPARESPPDGVVQPALGQRHLGPRRALPAARLPELGRPGTARPGRAGRAGRRARRSEETMAERARRSPPTGKPLKYQAMCLRRSAQAVPLVAVRPASSSACRRTMAATSPRCRQRRAVGRPANASARSRNSHGRPRQPRPITTPSTPVSLDHPQRVGGLPDVAVAEHRDRSRAALSAAIASQSACPE